MKEEDVAGKKKTEGKLSARTHDEVNLVLVSIMLAMTLWCFFAHSPFEDSLEARANAIEKAGFDPRSPEDFKPVFFWLDHVRREEYSLAPIYTWTTVAAIAYSIFDIGYILLVPKCTTRHTSLIIHHLATISLATGAIGYGVEPLTALCMIVEVNTFILTLKNLIRAPTIERGAFSSFAARLAGLIPAPIVNISFVVTWIGLRHVYYPWLLLVFHRYFGHHSFGTGGYIYVLGSLLTLNACNQLWSYGQSNFLTVFVLAAAVFYLCSLV